MFQTDVKMKIEDELSRGEAARRDGFEGRARVCARRAAGAAIREFLRLRGLPMPGPNAVDLLAHLHVLAEGEEIPEGVRAQVRDTAAHLLTRVDESFALPEQVDLLSEARWLAVTLEAHT